MITGLDLRVGLASEQGPRADNQDFAAAYLGDGRKTAEGAIAALADGVAGALGGRVAAELSVREVIEGFLSAKPTLGVRHALAPVIEAVNDWICHQGRQDPALAGMAATLTVLVLRGREAHMLHVGDSRLYRWRDGQLQRLSEDHVPSQPESRNILLRAIGLEIGVRIDYAAWPLRAGDRFLLCSDGVHGYLSDRVIGQILAGTLPPEETARRLVEAALANAGGDNATALMVDVLDLPDADIEALTDLAQRLPLLPVPAAGDTIDGFKLGFVLSDGREGKVFRAEDMIGSPRDVVLKFPKPSLTGNPGFRAAFLRELWISSMLRNPRLAEALALPPERQTRLYMAAPYYAGGSMADRLRRAPPVSLREGVGIAVELAKAVAVLHGAGVIHRDIKPENVLLPSEGGVRLSDLGVALLPGREASAETEVPGTASYMAPEQLLGPPADRSPGTQSTDIYALGVTIYRLFTAQFPYGEIEPFSQPRFGRPMPLSNYRPDLPLWLEILLERMVAIHPADRPGTALEAALAFETGLASQADAARRLDHRRPLLHRNPVLFWQMVSLGLLILVLVLLRR